MPTSSLPPAGSRATTRWPALQRWLSSRGLSHRQRLIDRRHDLRHRKLIEALAIAVDAALAALQLARQAGQRVLHQPDVAAMLDRAGSGPGRIEATDRPWPPNARICRSVQGHG